MGENQNNNKNMFIETVKSDISSIDSILSYIETNGYCNDRTRSLISELVAIYESYIPDIENATNYYREKYFGTSISGEDLKSDLKIIRGKLELFWRDNCTPTDYYKNKSSNINVHNHNINSNKVNIDIYQEFKLVRDEIKNTGYLTQEEIEDILKRIDQIEGTYKSDNTKPEKWNKLKSCMNWLSTKGVDIALKLMPLIMKSLEN